jgi:CheY-like chemotaxis protein
VEEESDRVESATPALASGDLFERLSRRVVGQPSAMRCIVPHIQMYQAGLNPQDRPAGVFLLLGPTGTGKTRTVEALAEILHGTPYQLLKIDCAEYQSDHEVAKLIGAPPGYVGHRETKPLLTQERLAGCVSPECDLALVLFDEIEKAAPSLTALLLGVLDRATLRLGDNTTVNFEKTLIFLTSNLGAREMLKETRPDIGFQPADTRAPAELAARLESIGLGAMRKRFSPEFVNRIDAVITYQPLNATSLAAICDYHLGELQRHVHTRLGERSFDIEVTPAARQVLLEKGSSQEYGARELKRTIHRMLTQPLAAMVADGRVEPGGRVIVDAADTGDLDMRFEGKTPSERPATTPATVLVVDDNEPLLTWLQHVLADTGVTPVVVTTAHEAREVASQRPLDLAIVDVMLTDGDGLSLALELLRAQPRVRIVVMTGMELSSEEVALCARQDFPVIRKPFLASDLVSLTRASLLRSAAAGG